MSVGPKDQVPSAPVPGRLTIYVGPAPGVGKTYKMLQDAHVVKQKGYDVVIGWLETHGRRETADQVKDLEIVPAKVVMYQGRQYREMDKAAILARNPKIALVDELAHSNVPEEGANDKRYQDILDLLDAGIDVVTTVNIQHLESLYDKVAHITGIQVRERVPDAFVDRARELKLVDVSPETLQERLVQGKIYAPDKVESALAHFFQLGRLAALRELALLEVADNVDQQVEDHAEAHAQAPKEKILVCVSYGPHSEQLIRRGWRIADRLHADLVVLVVTPSAPGQPCSTEEQREIDRVQRLSSQFNAEVLVKDAESRSVGEVIVQVARDLMVSQIVIGQPTALSRRGLFRKPSPVDYVLEHAEFVDLHVVGNAEGRTS